MRYQCGFNASKCARAEGYGNTLVLVPSRNSARGRYCFAVSPPSMPTGRSLCQGNAQNKPCKCAKAQSAGTTGQKGQRDGRVMGHMRHIGHMRQKRPHKAGKCPHKAHLLRKKRGQSVSDGMSRASFGVFAVNLPGSAAAKPPLSAFSCVG